MSKIYQVALLCLLPFITSACEPASQKDNTKIINHNSNSISYWGRVETKADYTSLFWSGSSVRFNYKGENASILWNGTPGDNYYNVLIDGEKYAMIKPDTIKQYTVLAKDLENKKHTIEIFKRNEWTQGSAHIYGLKMDGKLLTKEKTKTRKIEFYGNSITAGYGVEDTSGKDSPDSTFTNNYISYSNLTARHFNAEYRCICHSGIGITVSWHQYIMPEIYDRLNPNNPTSKNDFASYQPQVVVVNLLQNDSWIVNIPNNNQFIRRFGSSAPSDKDITLAYQEFITKIRQAYPNSEIVCLLGNMDITRSGSKWPSIVKDAVSGLNDKKTHTVFAPYKETDGHPLKHEQQAIADKLINYIEENISW